MNTTRLLLVLAVSLTGCSEAPVTTLTSVLSSPPTSPPSVEWFVAMPVGLPVACGPAVRHQIENAIEKAEPGTPFTFFMADNQELLATFVVSEGSPAYRRKMASQELAPVYERLDPELAGGGQDVDLIALPASIRKYRKSSAPPRVVVIGSPLAVDREGNGSITESVIPCDGCATDAHGAYARMQNFPDDTTLTWFSPEANYGNGPNHRTQIEHHLRYVVKVKHGRLFRISPDAAVVFGDGASQWDDEVAPQDNCNGVKEVNKDKQKAKVYTSEGDEVIETSAGVRVRVRKPVVQLLVGPGEKTLFLPDTSGSVAFDPNGADRSEVFDAIKADLCEKLDTMPFTHFAICGFGGWQDYRPRLSKYPDSMLSGIYWCDATRENRDRAIRFVQGLKAGGGTPTLAALQEALKLEGPLMCVLYSDGVPTLGEGGMSGVLEFAKSLKEAGVVINTIGVGALSAQSDQFDWTGGDFLARLSLATGGEYFALENAPTKKTTAKN